MKLTKQWNNLFLLRNIQKKSIFRRTCIILCGTAILQGVIFTGFIFISQTFGNMTQDAHNVLADRVDYRRKTVEAVLTQNINDEILFDNVNQTIQKTYKTKTSTPELEKELSTKLIEVLRTTKSTGSFIILDKDAMNLNFYPTMYLRDNEPNSVALNNADIIALYGNGTALKNLNIPFDPVWSTSIALDKKEAFSDFYFKPFQVAKENPTYTAQELGYWSHPFRIQESDVEIITYTMPLFDDENNVYGVIGVEFSCDYLRSLLNIEELNYTENSAYSIGLMKDNEVENLLVKGPVFNSIQNQNVALESAYANTFTFEHSGEINVAAVSTLNIYKSNNPYGEEQWALLGIVEEPSLLKNVYDLRHTLVLSILLSLLAALCAAVFVSYRFATPILTLSKRLKEGSHNGSIDLPKVDISEIDDLSKAIEQLSQDVAYASSRVSRILHVMEVPIGVYAYNKQRDQVFCTEMVKQLLDFDNKSTDTDELTKLEFEQELNHLRSKIIHSYENEMDEETDKNVDLICIEVRHEHRWLRFQQIEHEDELLVVVNDVSKEIDEKKRLEAERDFDTLTNLLNRRAFRREVEEFLKEPGRSGAMIMWDLDNLKYINDTYGHDAGDRYIRAAATVLSGLDSSKALVSRMAGDEFLAFIHDMDDEKHIRKVIRDLHKSLLNYSLELPDGTSHPIRASAGICWYPKDGDNIDDLLRHADFAMYDAKNTIKGSIREFSKEAFQRDELLFSGREELNNLIDESRVKFVYQPIVDAKTGEIHGYEALMRPISDNIKTINDLFRLAKAQSKLHQMERLTWLGVMEQYVQWIDKFKNRKIFINSLPNVVLHPIDIATLEIKYENYLSNIVIEIIESDDLDMECTATKQRFCHDHGAQIAIDDFGSGYNNEGMLLKITPQYIKIDMEIIQGISHDEDRQQFAQYIVQFAHSKNALVIAEGIEEVDDLRVCIKLGIDLLQGFYLAFPDSDIQELEKSKQKRIRQFNELKK